MSAVYYSGRIAVIMKIYQIKSNLGNTPKIFCDTDCNFSCTMAKEQKNHILSVVYLNENMKEVCYNAYQLQSLKEEKVIHKPFLSGNECLISCEFVHLNSAQYCNAVCILDTGAACNVWSIQHLQQYFGDIQLLPVDSNIRLVAANDAPLVCLGKFSTKATISGKVGLVEFFVVKEGDAVILGLPVIKQFHVVIDLGDESNIDEGCDDSQMVNFITQISGKVAPPVAVWFTPVNKVEIANNDEITITLLLQADIDVDDYLYSRAVLWECSCLTKDFEVCATCLEEGPILSGLLKPDRTVMIQMKPAVLKTFIPQVDYFQGILNPTGQQFEKFSAGYQCRIQRISVEPPGFIWSADKKLDFSMGHMNFTEDENLQKSNHLFPSIPPDNSTFMPFSEFATENICSHCKAKNLEYFCDLTDPQCISLKEYQCKANGLDILDSLCVVVESTYLPAHDEAAWVFPIFLSTPEVFQYVGTLFPAWRSIIKDNVSKMPSLKIFINQELFQFGIIGKYPTSLETVEYFSEIANICFDKKIKTLCLLQFDAFKISKYTLTKLFHANEIKIYLIKFEHFQERFLLESKDIKKVFKIKIDPLEIQSTIAENKDVASQLNILTEDVYWVEKLKKLAVSLDASEGALHSLWSRGTHDIGLFTEGKFPFRPLVFKFPVTPGADLIPRSRKAAYINPNLIPTATEMLEELLSLGIISRGYTIFSAPTYWIPKSRPELSLQQHIEQGGASEAYVAGMPDYSAKRTLRAVHDFFDLNSVCYSKPISQMSALEQLKQICYSVKYISSIDVTGAFFSFLIDEQAQALSGFDSGISHLGRFKYLRIPMGFLGSKNMLDCALLYSLGNIDGVLLYSDNILVLSSSAEEHFDSVSKVLTRLRLCGMKVKASKTSLFCSNQIKLYGVIVCLKTGRLSPEKSKLEGLRNRAVPTTKKQLKSFLGSLAFFSQLAPLAARDIALLNKITRGKAFCMTDEALAAYERLQELLSKSNLLFVYRPDYTKKFHISVDSSDYHSGWLVFQLCQNGHPRVVSYNMRTWDKAYEKLIVALKELFGIVACLKSVQSDMEYSKGCLLYTDSLPFILCSLASKFNRKLSRYKLYLQSLHWLELCYSPGTSPLLAMPDYLSRNLSEDRAEKQRLPGRCDIEKCYLIQDKICQEKHYKALDSIFMIDELLNLSESNLQKIKPKSCFITIEGKVSYETVDDPGTVFKDSHNDVTENVDTLEKCDGIDLAHHNDLFVQKGLCSQLGGVDEKTSLLCDPTDKLKSSTVEFAGIPEMEENVEDVDACLIQRVRTRSMNTESPSIGGISSGNIVDLTNTEGDTMAKLEAENELFSSNSEVEMVLSQFNLKDPNFTGTKDIAQYLAPDFLPEINKFGSPVGKNSDLFGGNVKSQKNKLERFYDSFIDTASHLNIDQLYDGLCFDPFWSKVVAVCEKQDIYLLNDKKFFLYKDLLLCKEKYKGITIFKVVIPDIFVFSFVTLCHRHYACIKADKLCNQISLRFEIRNLRAICQKVTQECFNCSLNSTVPCGKYRETLPKNPMLLRQKLTFWSLDELTVCAQVTGERKAGWNKLLCATCHFSHFVVVEPIIGTLDERKVLNFIQTRIIQAYGYPVGISGDNASVIASANIKKVLSYLGIYKVSTNPYSARSNIQELLNKLILDTMRNIAVGSFCSIEDSFILLTPVVSLVNSIVFAKEKILSPFLIVFGQLPRIDVINFFDGNTSVFKSKHDYLKQLILLNSAFNKIRLTQIEGRQYKENSKKVQNYFDQIQRGSIVSILNPDVRAKKKNHKLLPRYRDRFIVVKRTQSSAYIKPCSEVFMKHFLKETPRYKELTPQCYYKVDIENLKLLRNLHIVNSNKQTCFYSKFLQGHTLPENKFFWESKMGAELRNFENLLSQDQIDNSLMEELADAESNIRVMRKIDLSAKVILKPSYRHLKICEIAACFRSIGANQQIVKTVASIKKKGVSFSSEVQVFPLIRPNLIYFARKPYMQMLVDIPTPALRTCVSPNGVHYCYCNHCHLLLENCLLGKCPSCY